MLKKNNVINKKFIYFNKGIDKTINANNLKNIPSYHQLN